VNFKEPMSCGKKILKFTVLGDPVGQGRPRFTTIGGHVKAYDTKESRNEKAVVRLAAQQAMEKQGWTFPSSDMPIKVEIISYRKAPKSAQRWFNEAGLHGDIVPLTKPDTDNISKLYLDAMNSVVYPDDKQVYDLHICKAYSEQPRTEVVVTGYYLNLGEIKATANTRIRIRKEAEKNA
jgi:Holliday junction resolvase RusA-like endonuclease